MRSGKGCFGLVGVQGLGGRRFCLFLGRVPVLFRRGGVGHLNGLELCVVLFIQYHVLDL